MASLEKKVICPSPEDLEYVGPVRCPVEGCGKQLPSSACLRMHVLRRHHGTKLDRVHETDSEEGITVFYCPVSGCNRSKGGGDPFPRLGQLKQHYQTMHGEKKHTCTHCGKKFALRDACNRHEHECQQTIVCVTCGLDFRSRNALYQHAKRKGHSLPDKRSKMTKPKTQKNSSLTNVVFVPVPTCLKLVLPVPKRTKVVSSSTQTDDGDSSPDTLPGRMSELQSSSSQTTLSLLPAYSHTQLLCSPSELLTLRTHTTSPPLSSSPLCRPPLEMTTPQELTTPSVVSTQTDVAELCDFGTQTAQSEPATSLLIHSRETVTQPHCSSTMSYVESSTSLDLVEFGTQTLSSSETYRIGESDTVDFGTQTIGMTDLDDSLFSRNLLPPQCLDFGTQTIDYPYIDTPVSAHSVSICPATTVTSDTRDQGSQTHLNQ